MNVLLRRYIRSILLEMQGNARVPNQMPGTKKPGDQDRKKDNEDEAEELDEFSGTGAIAGFAAPLGYTGMDTEGPGAKGRTQQA